MTAEKKRRLRRRRRFKRNVMRTLFNIITAPARLPRISATMADQAMHASEISGMIFVAVLMAHLFNPDLFRTAFVVLAALVFVGFLVIVKLGDYQDQLDEMRLFVRF